MFWGKGWLDRNLQRLKQEYPTSEGWKPRMPEVMKEAIAACKEFYDRTLADADGRTGKNGRPIHAANFGTYILVKYGGEDIHHIILAVRFCKEVGCPATLVQCREMAFCSDWVNYAGEKQTATKGYQNLDEPKLAEYVLSFIFAER